MTTHDDNSAAPDEQASLVDIDEQLAAEADEVIDELDFDLEGEFLSGDEVDAILADETADALDPHTRPGEQDLADGADELLADFDEQDSEAAPPPPGPEPETSDSEPASTEGPGEATLLQDASDTPVGPQAEADDSDGVLTPDERNEAEVSAIKTDLESADEELLAELNGPPDSDEDELLDSYDEPGDIDLPAESAAVDDDDAPATEAADEPEPVVKAGRSVPVGQLALLPMRGLVAAVVAVDVPFGWVPGRVKNIIGLLGGLTLLAGTLVWALSAFA